MGQEIGSDGFAPADFARFREQLTRETALLRAVQDRGALSQDGPVIGLELEAWLIDHNFFPAPHNQSFLKRLGDPSVVAELSLFNIEVNAPVCTIAGRGLEAMHQHLSATLRRCAANAHDDVDTVIAIGTLPTLREEDLTIEAMTPSNRYAALNREAERARGDAPVSIDIASPTQGGQRFTASYKDVMLEAATTSFQLHLQVPCEDLWRYFNASIMLCAPLVAISANSPFLFGKPLWHETRIPVFEQALGDVGGPPRVTLGSAYMAVDPTAIFTENLHDYPVLLPFISDDPIERFPCLKLHNGTIWRWVRPIVGIDEQGTAHVRIEQRVLPAGPSSFDMMANAAFYFGVVHALADDIEQMMADLPIEAARSNFYSAAQRGLDAELEWPMGGGTPRASNVVRQLMPLAESGLRAQGMADDLIDKYLSTIAMRLATGQTGAAWQLAHFNKHGDLHRLTADYLEHQRTGMPVHEWTI
ncbi:MAG: hypothetical protein EP350_10740 [Alphaproteobacteria bacterium]|nr:MAG: hypothetical protein EP350_10740 [Alphaproteobacteria bacterium]